MPEFDWNYRIRPKQPIKSLHLGKIYLSNTYPKAIKQRRVIFMLFVSSPFGQKYFVHADGWSIQ